MNGIKVIVGKSKHMSYFSWFYGVTHWLNLTTVYCSRWFSMQKNSSLPCAAWGKTDAWYCCGCKQETHSKAELAIHTVMPSLLVGFLILCLAFSSEISTLFCRITSHCNRSFCSKGMLILKVGGGFFCLFICCLIDLFFSPLLAGKLAVCDTKAYQFM